MLPLNLFVQFIAGSARSILFLGAASRLTLARLLRL
jgi:hypothetical protein